MKEQDKNPGKQLNGVEIGNIPEKEFRIMIVKMIQDLGKRMEAKMKKMKEMFNKMFNLKELKNKQTEMNNIITEMKNTLEGINSRISEAEEWINELKNRRLETSASEKNKEKIIKINEDSLETIGATLNAPTFEL